VTSDEPLYERDPQAWKAHLAEGNATQARKRVSADVILRDPTGRLLLVNPTYKPDWDLPGGMAEANEPPQHAAHRELHEELGLTLPIGDLLCVDWIAPHGPWDDLLAFLFDAGTLTSDQTATLSLGDSELAEYRFCTHQQAAHYLRPYVWRRAQAALHALTTGKTCYLHNGYPAT
jgi:8-oxo-dGTP diphosphatase